MLVLPQQNILTVEFVWCPFSNVRPHVKSYQSHVVIPIVRNFYNPCLSNLDEPRPMSMAEGICAAIAAVSSAMGPNIAHDNEAVAKVVCTVMSHLGNDLEKLQNQGFLLLSGAQPNEYKDGSLVRIAASRRCTLPARSRDPATRPPVRPKIQFLACWRAVASESA